MTDSKKLSCGDIVRAARQDANMTQTELGELVGVGASAISLLETGQRNPSVTLAGSISIALKIPIGDLLAEYSQ